MATVRSVFLSVSGSDALRPAGSPLRWARYRREGGSSSFEPDTAFEGSRALRASILQLERHLSEWGGVKPFADDPRCLFRVATIPSPYDLRLPDGTRIACGDRVANLHLWNEHVPPLPAEGPSVAWGRDLWRRLASSMAMLSDAVRTNPELGGIVACRARTNFVGFGCRSDNIGRLIVRCGFCDVDEGRLATSAWIHDEFENLLIAALVYAHNPQALSFRKFRRVRRPVWISKKRLLALHPDH